MEIISQKDREVLRSLAKTQFDAAQTPKMQDLRFLWKEHNMGRGIRPMVTVETATFAADILPQLMKCEGKMAREIEWQFLSAVINHTIFGDDTVVESFFPVVPYNRIKPFDIEIKVEKSKPEDLGHHFHEAIKDLSRDFHLLKKSAYYSNYSDCLEYVDNLNGIFGDILPAKIFGAGLYAVPTQDLVHIMSMETLLLSVYDCPDLFLKAMEMLTNDYISFYRFLEQNNLIMPTVQGERVAQGTYAFTEELPQNKEKYFSRDVWGFLDSQETVGLSPLMFKEFIFPFYKRLTKEFGLLSYGCCEPVHPIWESCLKNLQNLRKLSISPWCDEKYMGERLAGSRIIYHRKPNPTYLGVGKIMDEEALRKHIRTSVNFAKGCITEFTQRDVYSVGGSIEKVRRYVQIVREETQDSY